MDYSRPVTLLLALSSLISCGKAEPPPQAAERAIAPDTTPHVTLDSQLVRADSTKRPDIPDHVSYELVHDSLFDDTTRLVLAITRTSHGGICCSGVLHIAFVDRADTTRRWEVDAISEKNMAWYEVMRTEPSAIVLRRSDFYGFTDGAIKLFLDPLTRRSVKRVEFSYADEVRFASDTEAESNLGVSAKGLAELRKRKVFLVSLPAPVKTPALFAKYPLPQSTQAEFVAARPDHLRLSSSQTVRIKEEVGAWHGEQGGFWFGKTFYDGEGVDGVGAIGFLSGKGVYSFLDIPALSDWSVDVMLVEPDELWAGLVGRPEGADYSGGLLRYDRKTKHIELFDVPGVIQRIVHLEGAIFLGTERGLFVVRERSVTRYHMEPGINGKLAVLSERVNEE